MFIIDGTRHFILKNNQLRLGLIELGIGRIGLMIGRIELGIGLIELGIGLIEIGIGLMELTINNARRTVLARVSGLIFSTFSNPLIIFRFPHGKGGGYGGILSCNFFLFCLKIQICLSLKKKPVLLSRN